MTAPAMVTMVTVIVVVRRRGLARITTDTAMVTVAITIDTRAVVERMEMLRRGCSLLLLLLLLMQLPTVVSVTAIPAHLNLVRVVVQIGTLLLLLLLVMMMTTVGH